jgi:YidC/Oxa1 family membrane protein insertase
MEKRAILAAVLMAALLIVYQMLFVSPSPPPPAPKADGPAATGGGAAAPGAAPTAGAGPAAAPAATPAAAVTPKDVPVPVARTVTVTTPLYRAEIGTVGGRIRTWTLDFRGEKPMALDGVVGTRGLEVARPGAAPRPIAFEADRESLTLGKDAPTGQVTLRGEDGFGLRVTQILRFAADSYAVEHELGVENAHTVAQRADLVMTWTAPTEWPKEQEQFGGARPLHVVRLAEGSYWARREYLTKVERAEGPGRWVAFESGVAPTGQNGVFLTALIPRSAGFTVLEAPVVNGGPDKTPRAAEIGWRAALPSLDPGQKWEGKAETYLGPMEYDGLKAFGVSLEKAIYFGGFPFPESWALRYGLPTLPMQWIVVPVLALMRWCYSYLPNYGFAIVLLTVITKVLFFPLTVKSMSSMKAMQALQPQVNALRAKHKSDPQRAQREMMELYRQHKVNPLGGCLPMVVQVPVFYALYDALSVSVELQGAPFVAIGTLPAWVPWLGGLCVWICDLAKPDPTYVLPILMGASMFVQQKMTPVMGDPRQAKMMLMMPILFTFMFLNLQSGLVLYWTLSNVLQIAQQKYMERGARPTKAPARAARKA